MHPTHSLSTITTRRTVAAKHGDNHDGCDMERVSAAVFMSYLPLLIRLMNWSALIEIHLMKLSVLIQILLMKWCSFGGPTILEMRIFFGHIDKLYNVCDNIDTVNASSALTFGGGISRHGPQKCWHAYYILAI